MQITRSHNMTREAAKQTVESLLPRLVQRFGDSVSDLRHGWTGDSMEFSFRARGFNVKGTLRVDDSRLVLDIGLPLAARLFEDTIRTNIERSLDETWPG